MKNISARKPILLLCLALIFALTACRADRYEEGYRAGYEAAGAERYETAHENGRAEGYKEGYEEGYTDGIESGQDLGNDPSTPVEDPIPEPTSELSAEPADSPDLHGFVLLSEAVPDVILEIRYYSTYNFVGERIDGYEEPVALLTKEAAAALKEVSDDLAGQGYRLKIFDAYRPQTAVEHFKRWALDPEDTRMKSFFYPELDKSVLFLKGYIASRSGHSRGSTVDLTLFDMATGKEVDMGSPFDFFGEISHAGCTDGLTKEQIENRAILRNAMLAHGFKGISTEWWHFTLADEPYPDTYFDFPVASPDETDLRQRTE